MAGMNGDERFFYARLVVPNDEGLIRAGMLGRGKISTGWAPVRMGTLPSSANVAVVESVDMGWLVGGHAVKQYILGLLMLTLACSGCNNSKEVSVSAASSVAAPAPENPPAHPATTNDTVVASGPIVVENQLDVEAQREGIVAAVLIQPGTSVRKGQLLATTG